jgi:pimeloyl-ACP methyl ester carboxylesterase
MPDIRLPAIRLYYEERGEGAPILCVHGTASSAMVWEGAVEALSRLGRAIAYDRRGCTRSERPEPYPTTSVAEHADDAAALLERLAATPAVVIGRSYGGEVALDLALRYPERVRALILLEGAPLRLAPEAERWEAALAQRVLAAAARGIDTVGEALLREVLGDGVWEQFPAQMKDLFTANGPAILAELRGGGLEADAAALAAIEQPTLLVTATDSPAPFRQATEALAAAMPDARTVLVGGGHLVDPAGPAVLGFIREVLAARGADAAAPGTGRGARMTGPPEPGEGG